MNMTPYANSLFEQPWWLDIVAPGRWEESVVRDSDGEVIARMPYVISRRWYGNTITMPPATQTLGPWFSDRAIKPGNSQFSCQKELISELLGNIPKSVWFLLSMHNANTYVLPYRWHGFQLIPSFSYRIDDLTDLDKVYERFHKSVKKNIRRSENTSIISNEADPELLHRMIEITFQYQNRRPHESKEFVTRIVNTCEASGHGRMFVARDIDGNVQVAAYMVYDENTAYALMSGSDPRFRSSCAKTRIYWEQIQYAAKVSKIFDFEGSMVQGIENIVRQFGGYQAINYAIMRGWLPFEMAYLAKPRVKRLLGYKI